MKDPIENYWQKRLETVRKNLCNNGFDAYVAEDHGAVIRLVTETILPETGAKKLSWGGSVTFVETGLYDLLKNSQSFDILDTYDKNFSPEQAMQRRRESLLTDCYITGTNAITEDGELVNLDMIGNRVAAITFGPSHVLILIGRNKICQDIPEAMARVKNYAAPVNTMRLDKKTPCVKTGTCHQCKSPDRICNTWVITEKSFPKKRIKVVLINADAGF